MILIISREADKSTDEVIGWLNYFKEPFFRINQGQPILIESFVISPSINFKLINSLTGASIEYKSIGALYYRVGCIDLDHVSSIPEDLDHFFYKERRTVVSLLYYLLEKNIFNIGSYFSEVSNNKLEDLMLAHSCGLNIPETIITTSKEEIIKFQKDNGVIISKPMGNFNIQESPYFVDIRPLEEEQINKLDDHVHPAMFQRYIEKEYEIRTFFVLNQMYSMAILSQKNEKTKYDFRDYDESNPNRVEPVELPKAVNEKLWTFISKKGLTTGSFDLILGIDQKIYFLELNPSGQFDWLTKRCNYNIEKSIAE